MTTYAMPTITPNDAVLEYVSNAQTYISPLSNAVQTVGTGGEYLMVRLSFRNLQGANAAAMRGWIAKLNGQQHRFTYLHKALNQQGNFGGTPLVAGADQVGTTLDIDGCSNNITDWIKAGDWFSVSGELKLGTIDSDTDGSGTTTLTFRPRLRFAPADNAAIETTAPAGTFMLAANTVQWAERPGPDGPFFDLSFAAFEDVTA